MKVTGDITDNVVVRLLQTGVNEIALLFMHPEC